MKMATIALQKKMNSQMNELQTKSDGHIRQVNCRCQKASFMVRLTPADDHGKKETRRLKRSIKTG